MVAIAGEFSLILIYDTWALIQSVLVKKSILGKHVLVELRRVNYFLMSFVLLLCIFQLNSIANRNYYS